MIDVADVALAIGLGIVATTLVLVFVFIFRQLAEVKRQLSALRVQVGTLRFQTADISRQDPPGGNQAAVEPPQGVRRKGNLWVVPLLFGAAVGTGRALRGFTHKHRAPIAALTVGAMVTTAALLYFGGFRLSHDIQAGPPPAPHTARIPPPPKPQYHPAVVRTPLTRRSRSTGKFAPASNQLDTRADVIAVSVTHRTRSSVHAPEHHAPPPTASPTAPATPRPTLRLTAPAPIPTGPVPCPRLSAALARQGLCLAGP